MDQLRNLIRQIRTGRTSRAHQPVIEEFVANLERLGGNRPKPAPRKPGTRK
jgi:hypothetical protein